MKLIQRHALYFAWLISLVALLVSFYWSEVRHFELCNLCWYQRGFFLSLAILLAIATFQRDFGVFLYAIPLTYAGALVAAYHILLQKLPAFQKINLCSGGPDCSQDILNYFGFLTTPCLSLIAFLLTLFFLYSAKKGQKLLDFVYAPSMKRGAEKPAQKK